MISSGRVTSCVQLNLPSTSLPSDNVFQLPASSVKLFVGTETLIGPSNNRFNINMPYLLTSLFYKTSCYITFKNITREKIDGLSSSSGVSFKSNLNVTVDKFEYKFGKFEFKLMSLISCAAESALSTSIFSWVASKVQEAEDSAL